MPLICFVSSACCLKEERTRSQRSLVGGASLARLMIEGRSWREEPVIHHPLWIFFSSPSPSCLCKMSAISAWRPFFYATCQFTFSLFNVVQDFWMSVEEDERHRVLTLTNCILWKVCRHVPSYYFRLSFFRLFAVSSIHSFDFPSFFLLFFSNLMSTTQQF